MSDVKAVKGSANTVTWSSVRVGAVADVEAVNDAVGFRPYVHALAAFLLSNNTKGPLTVSVEGPWGSGKTSFMRQLQQTLSSAVGATVAVKTIWFNPWMRQTPDDLSAAFAVAFVRQLRKQTPFARRIRGALNLFRYRYGWREGWLDLLRVYLLLLAITFICASLPWLVVFAPQDWTAVTLVLLSGGYAALLSGSLAIVKSVGHLLNPVELNLGRHIRSPRYEDKLSLMSRLQEDLGHVIDCYTKTNDRVFVFVDDIDRCEPTSVAELMKTISMLVSDNERLMFILAMDRKRVADSFSVRSVAMQAALDKSSTEVPADNYGYQYLERFIQLRCAVPLCEGPGLSEYVHNIVSSQQSTVARSAPLLISSTLENLENEEALAIEQQLVDVAPHLGNNPRRLKHCLNSVRLTTYMCAQTGLAKSVSTHQIVTFVALGIMWPRFLLDAQRYPTLITNLLFKNDDASGASVEWSKIPTLMALLRRGAPEGHKLLSDDVARKLFVVAPLTTTQPANEQ